MVQTFQGFVVYYKQQIFATVIDPDRANVEQFIIDYCGQNGIAYVANEWILAPSRSIISNNTMQMIMKTMNPVAAAGASNPYVAVEGNVGRIKLHPRSFD